MTQRKNRKKLSDVLKEELQDEEFLFYFEREQAISQIAHLVRQARQRAGLTQEELAHKVKTSQTVIARLESGNDSRVPSLNLLERIARSLKSRLLVSFEPTQAAS